MEMTEILEFEFVNHDDEIQDDMKNVVGMVAYFDCLICGFLLHFSKKYVSIRFLNNF